MRFSIKTGENIRSFGRIAGYRLLGEKDGEFNFARSLGRDPYPRFHAYLMARAGEIVVNLHLDQKRPSYEGAAAHSGEYDGAFLQEEAARMKNLFADLKSRSLDASDY